MKQKLNFNIHGLYKIAENNNSTPQLSRDFFIFSKILVSSFSLREYLFDHNISRENKKSVLKAVLEKENFSDLFFKILDQFINLKKEKFLPSILKKFLNIVEEEENISFCEALSTVSLSSKDLENISEILSQKTGQKITTINFIDSQILGGILIRYDDKIIDLSLRKCLQQLYERLSN